MKGYQGSLYGEEIDALKPNVDKLMEKVFPLTASISLSPTVIEKNSSTTVTLSWGSVKVDGEEVDYTCTVNGEEQSASPLKETLTDSKSYAVVITSGTRTLSSTKAVTAVYPTYRGFAVAEDAITADTIGSLITALSSTKQLLTSASETTKCTNDSTTKRMCIISPYAVSHIVNNSLDIFASDFIDDGTVTYNGATYHVYRAKKCAVADTFTYTIS